MEEVPCNSGFNERVRFSEDTDVSQSCADEDKPDKGRVPSIDCSCVPKNIISAAAMLTSDEREDVKRLGFGAFLDLKLGNNCSPKAVEWLISVSDVKKSHIAMQVKPCTTINLSPGVIHRLLKVPCSGTTKLPDLNSKDEFTKLKQQLGVENLRIPVLLKKLQESKKKIDLGEPQDKALRLRVFFLIVISNYLIPTSHGLASTAAVLYTSNNIMKMADYDWCTIIYNHLRDVIRRYDKSSRALHGCIPVLLVYFLENFKTERHSIDEDKGETVAENIQGNGDKGRTVDENSGEIARINLYTEDLVRKMINKAKRRGKHVYDNFQFGKLCYGESSTTQMSSVEFQYLSAPEHSEGLLAAARTTQSLEVKQLQELLFELESYAPPELKDKILAATRPPVETLYRQHVLAKIGSSDKSKIVFDINDFLLHENYFVDSFKPEGRMNSVAVHAQCSLWNARFRDRIYLKQECAAELLKGESDKHLSLQLPKKDLERLKLIFVPIFVADHSFLVVLNFHTGSFDYLDSLKGYFEFASTVTENLKAYLYKHGIDVMTWVLSAVPVMQQNNSYDCGYRLMLHMINYGKKEVHHITEEIVSRYRIEFAIELLYNPANKILCTISGAERSQKEVTTRELSSSDHQLDDDDGVSSALKLTRVDVAAIDDNTVLADIVVSARKTKNRLEKEAKKQPMNEQEEPLKKRVVPKANKQLVTKQPVSTRARRNIPRKDYAKMEKGGGLST